MQIGILGAGHVGLAVGRRVIGAGHRVKLSSARGPQALTPVAQGIGAEAASVTEAAVADLVLLAVPWPAVADTLDPLPEWQGRILIDATNPFVTIDPLELAARGSKRQRHRRRACTWCAGGQGVQHDHHGELREGAATGRGETGVVRLR